jgi:alcohol dehydrogenase
MQQLFFIKKEKLEWREVKTPEITTGHDAIVRPFAVAKCDLDDAFLFDNVALKIKFGRLFGLIDPYYSKVFGNLMKGPFPFGHECVAEVIEIGEKVTNLSIGDIVSVPFQISCGTCHNCAHGFTSSCESVPHISTYGFGKHLEFGGAMSDFIKVPYADSMLLKIPKHIDPVHLASLSDNIPDAYRHVAALAENPNQSVLVISGKAKSVGIYAVLLAKYLGVTAIDYVDNNQERLSVAKNAGANKVYESFTQLHRKYDVVIDASSTTKGLETAFKSVRNYGTVTSSGIYIKKPQISLINMYGKGVNFKIGLANARTDAEKILELMDNKSIDFALATTKLDTWDNAIDALLTNTTKVIVTREKLNKSL